MPIGQLIWGTPIKRATTICAFVAALGSAIAAASVIEPYVPAWKGYVRDIADQRMTEYRPTVNSLLRWKAEDDLSKIESEKAQWSIKLKSEQDAETRGMIENRLKKLDTEKNKADQRLKDFTAHPGSGATAK